MKKLNLENVNWGKGLGILGLVLTVSGTIVTKFVDEKNQDKIITDKVEKIAEKFISKKQ